MKNIFKSLMFVAVAAMTFTACSEKENEGADKNEQKAKVEFVGVFDETRSAFGDKVGTSYPSYWEGNESALFHNTKQRYGVDEVTVENSAAANENAIFSAELINTNVGDSFVVGTPADAWETDWNYGLQVKRAVLNNQTPKANSVDSKVHALKAEVTYEGEGMMHQLNFKHEFAYGKMTLTNYEGAAVNKVVVTLSSMYGETPMTINASSHENIWFACIPVENPITMTIEVTDSNNNIYYRDLSGAEIQFVQGKVTSFKVDMKKVAEENEAIIFTSATAAINPYGYGPQDQYIYFRNENGDTLDLNLWDCFKNNTWPTGEYVFSASTTPGTLYPDTYLNGVRIDNGTMNVSVVDGKYHIEFSGFKGNSGSFTGLIEGLNVPEA